MSSHYPSVIIGNFNKKNQSSTLQALMNKYNFKLNFLDISIINDTQINHLCINAPIQ
jgi:hypothetical protein